MLGNPAPQAVETPPYQLLHQLFDTTLFRSVFLQMFLCLLLFFFLKQFHFKIFLFLQNIFLNKNKNKIIK